jgi:integrase
MPNCSRYWRFNYRFDGRQKTLAMGTYPDVSLVRARERLQEARKLLADGIDPGAVKQAVSRDFEVVARAWLTHWRTGRSERYVAYVITRPESDVFPQIGSRPVSEVSAAEFRDVAQKIERRGALEMARRLLQNCGQIMRYGVANDLVQRNPVADIRPADILKPRKKRNYPRVCVRSFGRCSRSAKRCATTPRRC